MRAQLMNYSRILFVLMALGLSQCGKKTKSQDVTITAAPTNPIVFLSDFQTTIGGTAKSIKAPWFEMIVNIDNQSTDDLVILALHVEVTGTDANGAVTVNKMDLIPAANNSSVTANGTTITCDYSDFGTFTKGTKGALHFTPSNTGCESGAVLFMVDGNPAPANTSSIQYQVKIQPVGFFGSITNPQDRFDNFGMIFTQ
jgi:hypothetical protein